MGIATALNFQPTGAGKVAITGDFVLRAAEVNPVLGALREHRIQVTAVHNHMLDEQPRLFIQRIATSISSATGPPRRSSAG